MTVILNDIFYVHLLLYAVYQKERLLRMETHILYKLDILGPADNRFVDANQVMCSLTE